MAVRLGEHYVWTGLDWDLYYMKTRADNVQEVTTGGGKYFLTTDERNKISDLLTTFNAANKLIKLNGSGKFSSELMYVNDVIDMGVHSIINLEGLHFEDGLGFIKIKDSSLHLEHATKIQLDAPNTHVLGDLTVNSNINLVGVGAGKRTINGVNQINFVDSQGDVYINATPDRNLEFRWDYGGRTFKLTGAVAEFNGVRLTGLSDPSSGPEGATDAVNRQWVEQFVAQGTHVVAAVRAASTTNITSLSGTGTTVDGVTLAAEDRVLVKDQTTSANNGIYIVKSGAWVKLPYDSDKGSLAFVLEGSTNKGKQFYNSNGTTWTVFFIQDTYGVTVGGGLELDGTGFNFGIKTGGVTNSMLAGNISATKLMLLSNGGLESNSGNLAIKSSGVFNNMLAGNIMWSKLENTATNDGLGAWENLSAPATAQPLTTKINQLFSAIKNLRGTANYNTDNAQTISGAYSAAEGKNKTLMGTAVPPAGYTGAVGDSYVRQLS